MKNYIALCILIVSSLTIQAQVGQKVCVTSAACGYIDGTLQSGYETYNEMDTVVVDGVEQLEGFTYRLALVSYEDACNGKEDEYLKKLHIEYGTCAENFGPGSKIPLSTLKAGSYFKVNQAYFYNDDHFLVFQSDGNLVLYRGTVVGESTFLWGSYNNLKAPLWGKNCLFTDTGELSIEDAEGRSIWATSKVSDRGATLEVNDNNQLEIKGHKGEVLVNLSTK